MIPRRRDIAGVRSGLLTAISLHHTKGGRSWWLCRCECGVEKPVMAQSILSGGTRSCGATVHRSARMLGKGGVHHQSGTLTYRIWTGMRKRCNNPSSHAYARYGGRGIKVCDRWNDFAAFLADMGECPPGYEIDRFPDVNGNYEPGNCRWATLVEQANNKRNNRIGVLDGKPVTVQEYADAMGIKYATAYWRLVVRDKAPKRADLTKSEGA